MKVIAATAVHWKDRMTALCTEFHLQPSAEALQEFVIGAHELRRQLNEFFGRINSLVKLGEFSFRGVENVVRRLAEAQEHILSLARFLSPRSPTLDAAIAGIQREMERLQEVCRVLDADSSEIALAKLRKLHSGSDSRQTTELREQVRSLSSELTRTRQTVDTVLHRLKRDQQSSLRDAIGDLESLSPRPPHRRHTASPPSPSLVDFPSPSFDTPDFDSLASRSRHATSFPVDTLV
jgi:uncharacterized coiled-coil protein SlyX